MQIARQLGVESERSQLGKVGVLQAIMSGNAVKRLKKGSARLTPFFATLTPRREA